MAEILYGPWTGRQDNTPIASDQFKESPQLLLKPMIEAQRELFSAARPFKTTGDIRPSHCRKAINALEDITANISAFCTLLSATDSLPIFISSFRYPLLTSLYRLQKVVSDAILLTENYRITYKAGAYRTNKKRDDISEILSSISSDLQTFFAKLDSFATETRFQEARLLAIEQGKD